MSDEVTSAASLKTEKPKDREMYYKSSGFYDLLNSQKNYAEEVDRLLAKIEQHKRSAGNRLLDIACGTGEHVAFLSKKMDCEGLDVDPEFVKLSKEKLPQLTFHVGDMTTFKLSGKYDVVTCLFSSIGYVKTKETLKSTISNMAEHIVAGGLLIIEPWYTKQTFKCGHSTVVVEETEQCKIVRMNLWKGTDDLALGHSHILVMDEEGIVHIEELHELALFTNEEYTAAMEEAGLEVHYDEYGLIGRGLFVGIKQP